MNSREISDQVFDQLRETLKKLNTLENPADWGDIYNEIATNRDRNLTKSLCNDDEVDFIIERRNAAFLFTFQEKWEAQLVGQPIYWIDPELFPKLNLEQFIVELRHELPGIEIKIGSDSHNERHSFKDFFRSKIDSAINTAIKNSNN